MMYDYAIVGKGMIGAAAARYVSQHSDSVVLIGPDEPQGDWSQHNGVFASHYDQGRITRELDSTLAWALWAQRSIAEYHAIEAQSGIHFYHECGGIQVGLADGPYMPQTEQNALHLGTAYRRYSSEAFERVFPELHFGEGFTVLHETAKAGYINPRQLVQAQVVCCEQQGVTVVRQTVTKLAAQRGRVALMTDDGQQIAAQKVLVAAGAYTQFLTGVDLGVIPTPRTIVLARLNSAETQRLQHLPTIIFYEGFPNPYLSGVYILPPIEYPDGHSYIKLGGKMHDIDVPHSADDLNAWFHKNGSQLEAQELERELFNIIPSLQAEAIVVKPCVVTNQSGGHLPVIEEIVAGQVVVATAGCGSGAKSSNEIGRIAALKLMRV